MKQLCITNDTVMHPKASPRTLYVVASTPNACSRSGKDQWGGRCGETGLPTFAKDDGISRRPPLIAGEKTEAAAWKMPYNK